QRTMVGVTADHIWAGSEQDSQSFVDRSSHDDSPYAPCVTRPRVVVHPTPSRSPPGTGNVSVDAISTTAHLVPLERKFAMADEAHWGRRRNTRNGFGCSGGAHLDAEEYDRRGEGSHKEAVKVA